MARSKRVGTARFVMPWARSGFVPTTNPRHKQHAVGTGYRLRTGVEAREDERVARGVSESSGDPLDGTSKTPLEIEGWSSILWPSELPKGNSGYAQQ